jgi:hypothetical protein
VVYPNGVTVAGGTLRGSGTHYDLALAQALGVREIPLDSVVAMDSFRTDTNVAQTVAFSTLASVGAVIGTVAMSIALFGSCPTVYSGDGVVEEAELFFSSIAPLFEARDVDRLRARPDQNERLTLEIRNEAMETHYINHLQVLEVEHEAGELVLPDQQGRPVIVGGLTAPESVTDSTGRDVLEIVRAADDRFYSADRDRVESVTLQQMEDWIDVEAAMPGGAVEAVLVLRLRNSLLSTVLLYDEMLGPMGASALDWLGGNLSEISTAVELGRWHQKLAGLHVETLVDGQYQEVTRIPDSGPISWHDVAVVVPVDPRSHSLQVRMRFITDYWRIDSVGIGSRTRDANPRPIDVTEVTGPSGDTEIAGLDRLQAPDQGYLQTTPGRRFFAHFDVGKGDSNKARSFLLASQGYYTEWVRGDWIRNASTSTFEPTDAVLLDAIHRWAGMREDFEHRFLTNRVPVQ